MVSRASVIGIPTRLPRNVGYGGLTALCCFARATLGAAQAPAPEPEPVRAQLTVEAETSCATRELLAERVHARSQRITFVEGVANVPNLRVEIGGGATGDRVAELTVQWPDGRRSERRLTAARCEAAVDALSLLIAMTLDPALELGAAAGAAASVPTPQAEPIRPPEPEKPAPSNATAPHPLSIAHVATGASARLLSGAAPRAMPGFGLYGRLALNGAGLWAPALQLELARTWTSDLSEPGGDADFTIESAALDVCPLGLQHASFLGLACAAGALGGLTASGSNSYDPQTQHELWSALGASLLLSLGVGRFVELQGGFRLLLPLQRYRFAFRPDVFYQVASVCPEGHLGAGVRFP